VAFLTFLGNVQAIFGKGSDRRFLKNRLKSSHQEDHLQRYTALFIYGLQQSQSQSETGKVDLGCWINFLTADIVGEVILGDSFGCLERGQSHPWLAAIPWVVRIFNSVGELSRYPGVLRVIDTCWSWSGKLRKTSMTVTAISKRIEKLPHGFEFISRGTEATGQERFVP
jgi:hypothetical protein